MGYESTKGQILKLRPGTPATVLRQHASCGMTCSLFKGGGSNSDAVASIDWMFVNRRACKTKRQLLDLSYYLGVCLAILRENHENIHEELR